MDFFVGIEDSVVSSSKVWTIGMPLLKCGCLVLRQVCLQEMPVVLAIAGLAIVVVAYTVQVLYGDMAYTVLVVVFEGFFHSEAVDSIEEVVHTANVVDIVAEAYGDAIVVVGMEDMVDTDADSDKVSVSHDHGYYLAEVEEQIFAARPQHAECQALVHSLIATEQDRTSIFGKHSMAVAETSWQVDVDRRSMMAARCLLVESQNGTEPLTRWPLFAYLLLPRTFAVSTPVSCHV